MGDEILFLIRFVASDIGWEVDFSFFASQSAKPENMLPSSRLSDVRLSAGPYLPLSLTVGKSLW